jgi:hypothetical protein
MIIIRISIYKAGLTFAFAFRVLLTENLRYRTKRSLPRDTCALRKSAAMHCYLSAAVNTKG